MGMDFLQHRGIDRSSRGCVLACGEVPCAFDSPRCTED